MEFIPAIDLRGGKCVRLRQGDYNRETVFSENPLAVAKEFQSQGATRLHLVDLDGARGGSKENRTIVEAICESLEVPCEIGGGIRCDEIVDALFSIVNLQWAVVGTQAVKQPDWFRSVVERYPHRIYLGVDARDAKVAVDGWLDVSEMSPVAIVRQYRDLPLAGVIYTNIASDGMMTGLNDSTKATLEQLDELGLPMISSGGISSLDDLRELLKFSATLENLQGTIIGRALYENAFTLSEAMSLL